MQRADEYTIQKIGIPSLVLMERAALKTVEVMKEKGISLDHCLVVCGSGNNGGDGFAVARLLYLEGKDVCAVFAGKETSMSEECRQQRQIASNLGVSVVTNILPKEYTVVIDAVFGVGLSRTIEGHYKDVIPVEIGIGTKLFEENPEVCYTLEKSDLSKFLPDRKKNSHKGSYGKILMITGSKGMSGAAYLSARAAYISGGGLVQIYTEESNRTILQQLLPEAIVSTYTEYEEEKLQSLLKWADVICIGCGLGKSRTAGQILSYLMKYAEVPCVIDADGLNLLADHMELLPKEKKPFVLTPHMKEMAGLLGCTIPELGKNRFAALKEFTDSYGVVCVLKDARTLVAGKDRQMFLNTAGNSAMAKAGSGDVLAGVITGLLAQHMKVYEGTVLGVYLHACGGDAARERRGAYSVLAEDLTEGIAACIKKTEKGR